MVARIALGSWLSKVDEIRKRSSDFNPTITFGAAVQYVVDEAVGNPDFRPLTKVYWQQNARRILKCDPSLSERRVSSISESEWITWAAKLRGGFSAWTYNKALQVAKTALNYCVIRGAIGFNPIVRARIKGRQGKLREIVLPSAAQFANLVHEVRTSGCGYARSCGDLIELLAFTGMRISEARNLLWSDVDLGEGHIAVRESKTASGRRIIPLIKEAKVLLEHMHAAQDPEPSDKVSPIRECQKSLKRACAIVGCQPLTQHDLRRLFATRAIECEIDIPTIARWLGHKDGGALLMRVYGRLRDEHSKSAARKFTFKTGIKGA